ncbi:S-layer homology domain-containing protein [Paenibacillus sp. MMO-58]|uniref:S-layer homology domain-containing protein n=1 Tax=Paenibacillus sp. MMO-58 TaxID=3081290 RepID=UPI003017A20A
MKNQNGAKSVMDFSGRKLLIMLTGMLLVLSLFSPMAGNVAYAGLAGLTGDGTESNPWQIGNANELASIGKGPYTLSGNYKLKSNIVLDGLWGPIGNGNSFTGNLDGNGKTISGLEIDMPTTDNVGLFAATENARIYNLTVELGSGGIVGHDNVGILAGAVRQTGSDKAGFMFVTVKGTVTGNKNVGGLAGKVTGEDNSRLLFAYDRVGPGTVTGANAVGGLVGYWKNGFVYNSHAEATVAKGARMGGLLGYAADSRVFRSYAVGDVGTDTDRKDEVGGLIGSAMFNQLYASYATGRVAGGNYVGGLIGNSGYDSITQSYAAGGLDATGVDAGGLIGANEETVVMASYWDKETSGKDGEDQPVPHLYGSGRSTAELQDAATFTSDTLAENNWDFDHVWYAEDGQYPRLYAGMDFNFYVQPSYVSDQYEHAHDLTIGMFSDWLWYGHRIGVYQASDDAMVAVIEGGSETSVRVSADTTGLIDGNYNLGGYYFKDQYGNRTSVFYPSMTVDNTSPTWPEGDVITESEWYDSSSVAISFNAATDGSGSGIDYYNLYVNGVGYYNNRATTIIMAAPSSPAYYEVEAVDKAGNKSIRLTKGTQGTPSTTFLGGSKNVVIGQQIPSFYTASVTGAPSHSVGIFNPVSYGGTMTFYVDGVQQGESMALTSPIGPMPTAMFILNTNDLSEGAHTIKAVYSGYAGDFYGNDFNVKASEATYEITVSGLNVASSDPSGAANNGKTKLTVTPDASAGHKLMYRNFGADAAAMPNIGDVLTATGYADLPADGLIPAATGDKIGVVEIETETGKVVHFGQAMALAIDDQPGPVEATGLTVTSVDPSGSANDGKTKLTVTPDASEGNKLVYRNFGSGSVTVPNVGVVLTETEYTDLPADGLIAASGGDKIGVAEIETETGKVVRFGQATAVVTDEPAEPGAATGLTVTSVDPSGSASDGKTKLTVTPDASEGNKLVYLNFGSGSVTVPNVDDVLTETDYTDLPADGLIAASSGDKIGVAEIQTVTGKVVRFGQATAVVTDEPAGPGAATGLTVTASDPSGSANDGKTKLTVTPDVSEGHKLVYRNFASSDVIVPNVDEVLTGYTDLPADGLIPAMNGDKIGVGEIDTATGTVVHFGKTIAIVSADTPNPGPSTSVSSAADNVDVLVNGKVENMGKSKMSETGGVKTLTVTVDPAKLQAKLDAEGSHAVVTIPVKSAADLIIGELNGQIVKNMENASATLVLQTDKAAYTLPAQQINIDAISGKLGKSVALEDIKIQVEIAVPAADKVKLVENAAEKGTFTLVAPPVEFTVRGTYGDQTVQVTQFNAYVERTIAIPDGVDPSKITTGVVVDPDGTVRHVPTKLVVINGKHYVKINSLTNSTYSVVWHPLEFADMTKHWAKDAVNDMGSRMVIEGTGNGLFSPDRTITRAEFVAIVVRGLGLKLESGEVAFPDVKASDWYFGAVNTAVKYGLINGFADGAFRPDERITREQAMTILAKAMKVTGLKGKLPAQSTDAALRSFADAAEASSWAKTGISDCVQAGIVSGRGEATLAPNAYVSRAEVAMMVRNLLQKSDLI